MKELDRSSLSVSLHPVGDHGVPAQAAATPPGWKPEDPKEKGEPFSKLGSREEFLDLAASFGQLT